MDIIGNIEDLLRAVESMTYEIKTQWDLTSKSLNNLSERIGSIEQNYTPIKLNNMRIKDIEYRLSHIVEFPTELDIRLQEAERRIDKISNIIADFKKEFMDCSRFKIPHRCPVCDGYGSKKITDKTANGPRQHFIETDPCNSCSGKGIVWS